MTSLLLAIVYLGLAVAVVGLVCRVVPMTVDNVRFRDTDESSAANLIAQFADGTYENRFGFPTGFFHEDEKKSNAPTRIVFQEAQPSGSVTDGCAIGIGQFGGMGFDEGCLMGAFVLIATAIIAAPFVIVSTVDRVYRYAMRSKVTIDIRREQGDSIATMRFYGISGYLTKARYQKAFSPPILPDDLAAPVASGPGAPLPPPQPQAQTIDPTPTVDAHSTATGNSIPSPPTSPGGPTPATGTMPSASPAKLCRSCKVAIDAVDTFCVHCGANQAAECRSCGATLNDDDVFCIQCGTKR